MSEYRGLLQHMCLCPAFVPLFGLVGAGCERCLVFGSLFNPLFGNTCLVSNVWPMPMLLWSALGTPVLAAHIGPLTGPEVADMARHQHCLRLSASFFCAGSVWRLAASKVRKVMAWPSERNYFGTAVFQKASLARLQARASSCGPRNKCAFVFGVRHGGRVAVPICSSVGASRADSHRAGGGPLHLRGVSGRSHR